MGVIKASREYDESIQSLRDSVNCLGEILCKIEDSQATRKLIAQYGVILDYINWLDVDKDALFEAIDKALDEK